MIKQISNPLIDHYLGIIRNKDTQAKQFTTAISNVTQLMAGVISEGFYFSNDTIQTPITEMEVAKLDDNICLVPVLRAGLSMLEPMRNILPYSACGYMGLKRKYKNDDSSSAELYYCNLPGDIANFNIYLLEVVLASGITIRTAVEYLIKCGAEPKNINIVSLITCDYGIKKVLEVSPNVNIYYCDLDDLREEDGYLVPGLGDAGDRYCR